MFDKLRLPPPRSHLPDVVAQAARRWGDFPAILSPERSLMYDELNRLVAGTARRLREAGVEAGTRVGVVASNTWRTVVVLLAVIRAGGVACLLSTRTPLEGLASLLDVVQARLLIAEDSDEAEPLPTTIDVWSLEAMMEEGAPGEEAQVPRDRAATAVFTSGSTGTPKAALHSLGNHVYSALGSNANIALGPSDRWLLVLPLYHVGGLGVLFRCLLAGAAVVIPAHRRALGEAAAGYRATHVSLVATQLRRWLRTPSGVDGLRAMLVGGSAVPLALIRAAHEQGWPIHTTYGLTEMTSQVTTTPPRASLDHLATSGRLLPYRDLTMAGDGEILVRGATLFLGYLEAAARHRPLDPDGWYHTGDLGRLDADGWLHVVGRKDNLFISGGENIQPEEIERALCGLDGIAQAVVVPVLDAEFGQRPVAFIRWSAEAESHDALAVRLEALLPRFKIPIAFYDWPEVGASPGLKLDRSFFRARAEELRREKK